MSDPDNFPTILTPLTKEEATLLVKAKATYFKGFVRIFIPNTPYTKIDPRYEPQVRARRVGKLKPQKEIPYEDDLERSLRRTRKTIKDLVANNDFDLFCSFTFADDRQNISRCRKKMSDWLKNQQKRYGKFEYLIVMEFHKDKKSPHFHALFSGYTGRLERAVNPKTGKLTRKNQFRLASYTHGYSNARPTASETKTTQAYYLQKYLTKEMPIVFGQKRYWNSENLKRPPSEDNPAEWYEHFKADRTYQNDYGIVLEFDKGNNPITDLFLESKQQ